MAEVNGDDLPDLLVAEPESGQISSACSSRTVRWRRQRPSHLAGISDLAAADWDGDGPAGNLHAQR